MRRQPSAQAALRIGLLLVCCGTSACQGTTTPTLSMPAPSDKSAWPSPISTPPTQSRPPVARFTLTLTAAPTATRGFVLYLSTAIARAPSLVTLCGGAPAPPCDVAHSPFSYVIGDLPIGTQIVFRIERIASDDRVQVLLQGSEILGHGSPEQKVSYP